MTKTNRSFNFVYVLSTCSGTSHRFKTDVSRINIDFNRVIHQRIYINRNETRMTFCITVKRRNSHQSVNAIFTFQITKSEFPFDFKGYSFYASNITFLEIQFTDFVALFVCPHRVHTHQHTCPIARFCSAGSSCDLQNRRQFIAFIRQHIFEFQIFDFFYQLRESFVQFFFGIRVFFGKFYQNLQILELRFDFLIAFHPFFFGTKLF